MAELSEYDVPHRNGTMRVKLSAEDAELLYGDRAEKVGDVEQAQPQSVQRPPYAEPVPPPGESTLVTSGEGEKQAAPRRNKARTADSDKS